jgi:hypothetical protein
MLDAELTVVTGVALTGVAFGATTFVEVVFGATTFVEVVFGATMETGGNFLGATGFTVVTFAGMASAGMVLDGMALAGVALAGVTLAGVALAGVALTVLGATKVRFPVGVSIRALVIVAAGVLTPINFV